MFQFLFKASNPVQRSLLDFYIQAQQIDGAGAITPDSAAGRKALNFWFTLQQFADSQINMVCNAYYEQKHPKHYLWLGHNQFLYDNVQPGERVLDIGCGTSYYQQWIAEKAAEVVGVDIKSELVELARRNNPCSNVRFEVMDVTQEVPADKFDVVICSHVLEHLDDPDSFLQVLAARVPRLLVKVPLVDSHWMKLVKKDIGMFYLDDADHRREYTETMLEEQLTQAGWHITELIRGFDLRAVAISPLLAPNLRPGRK